MVTLDFAEINALESAKSRQEFLSLTPPDSFTQAYAEYRYHYVNLVNALLTNLKASRKASVVLRALGVILERASITPLFLLKAELSLIIFTKNARYPTSIIESLRLNAEHYFRAEISAMELLLIHEDYSQFVERLYAKEKRPSWENHFRTPLFALYHMHERNSEMYAGLERLAFLSTDRQTRGSRSQKAMARGNGQASFQQMLNYSEFPNFCAFWIEKLGLLGSVRIEPSSSSQATEHKVKSELEQTTAPAVTISPEVVHHLVNSHRKVVEGFCALLMRTAGSQAIAVQNSFFDSLSSNELAKPYPSGNLASDTYLKKDQSTTFSQRKPSTTDWVMRRQNQLHFLLRCESVSQVTYRKNIILAEIHRLTKEKSLSDAILPSRQGVRVRGSIDDQQDVDTTASEEFHAAKMVRYYHSLDRGVGAYPTLEPARSAYREDHRISTEDVLVTQQALGLYVS